ncbi:MAG: chaperone NapD [Nitrospinota bacterium]|nr:chaperone NapD [Nitrospinota bacterium]
MNISSLVVAPEPGQSGAVMERLAKIDGLEVTHLLDDGRIIVVIERESTSEEAKAMRSIIETGGVATASLAYHYFEEETLER